MSDTGYFLVYAPSSRAICRGPKPCTGTIVKGELRLGTLIDMRGMKMCVWRHWGCVTPKIFEDMKKEFKEGSELDGYDDLKPEDQAKVIKAWQAGRIPDEDIFESARKPADEDDEEKHKKTLAKRKATASGGDAEERPTTSKRMTAAVEKTDDDSEDVIILPNNICSHFQSRPALRDASPPVPTPVQPSLPPICMLPGTYYEGPKMDRASFCHMYALPESKVVLQHVQDHAISGTHA